MNFVLYHANCDDGFGAAWAMYRKLGPDKGTVYIPVNYGENVPILEHVKGHDKVWIVDFSYPMNILEDISKRAGEVRLYDHHRTAFQTLAGIKDPSPVERYSNHPFPNTLVVLANDKSGASLTWELENGDPTPLLISYIEDNDLWSIKLPQTRAFKHMLRSYDYEFAQWDGVCEILEVNPGPWLEQGLHLERAFNKYVKYMAEHAYGAVFNDFPEFGPFLAASSHHAFSSDLGHILAQRSETFGLCYYDKGENTYCSLRADGNVDVAAIAGRFGGGGHKNAAGFTVPMDRRPWRLQYAT